MKYHAEDELASYGALRLTTAGSMHRLTKLSASCPSGGGSSCRLFRWGRREIGRQGNRPSGSVRSGGPHGTATWATLGASSLPVVSILLRLAYT